MKKKMSVGTRQESKLKMEVLLGQFMQLNFVDFYPLMPVICRSAGILSASLSTPFRSI